MPATPKKNLVGTVFLPQTLVLWAELENRNQTFVLGTLRFPILVGIFLSTRLGVVNELKPLLGYIDLFCFAFFYYDKNH